MGVGEHHAGACARENYALVEGVVEISDKVGENSPKEGRRIDSYNVCWAVEGLPLRSGVQRQDTPLGDRGCRVFLEGDA
jgi:hypothetical protein